MPDTPIQTPLLADTPPEEPRRGLCGRKKETSSRSVYLVPLDRDEFIDSLVAITVGTALVVRTCQMLSANRCQELMMIAQGVMLLLISLTVSTAVYFTLCAVFAGLLSCLPIQFADTPAPVANSEDACEVV